MSMIQPEDEAFKLYRINVADFAAIAGLDKDHLYEELREVAVGLKANRSSSKATMSRGTQHPVC